jgi:hypothetical protein
MPPSVDLRAIAIEKDSFATVTRATTPSYGAAIDEVEEHHQVAPSTSPRSNRILEFARTLEIFRAKFFEQPGCDALLDDVSSAHNRISEVREMLHTFYSQANAMLDGMENEVEASFEELMRELTEHAERVDALESRVREAKRYICELYTVHETNESETTTHEG